MKNQNLGAMIEALILKEILQRLVIAFIDNTDFYTNEVDYKNEM